MGYSTVGLRLLAHQSTVEPTVMYDWLCALKRVIHLALFATECKLSGVCTAWQMVTRKWNQIHYTSITETLLYYLLTNVTHVSLKLFGVLASGNALFSVPFEMLQFKKEEKISKSISIEESLLNKVQSYNADIDWPITMATVQCVYIVTRGIHTIV